MIVTAALFAGVVFAAPELSLEAEDGSITGNARVISNAQASRGSAIAYGSGVTNPNPTYANDKWLFIGDSITVMSVSATTLENLVKADDSSRNPDVTNIAIGGSSAGSWGDSNPALGDINTALASTDAEFVPLALGTNDYHVTFEQNYEVLVQRVIAAGKTPVLPYIPWTNNWPAGHAENYINPAIERILAKYPEALRGPNLFAITENRPNLFKGSQDVHPNDAGQALLRQAWANMMLTVGPGLP